LNIPDDFREQPASGVGGKKDVERDTMAILQAKMKKESAAVAKPATPAARKQKFDTETGLPLKDNAAASNKPTPENKPNPATKPNPSLNKQSPPAGEKKKLFSEMTDLEKSKAWSAGTHDEEYLQELNAKPSQSRPTKQSAAAQAVKPAKGSVSQGAKAGSVVKAGGSKQAADSYVKAYQGATGDQFDDHFEQAKAIKGMSAAELKEVAAKINYPIAGKTREDMSNELLRVALERRGTSQRASMVRPGASPSKKSRHNLDDYQDKPTGKAAEKAAILKQAEAAGVYGMKNKSVAEIQAAIAGKPAPKPVASPSQQPASRHMSSDDMRAEIKKAGDDSRIAFGKINAQIKQHFSSGGKVTAWMDGKPINIVNNDGGNLRDDKGQQWGMLALTMSLPGKKGGIEFHPPAKKQPTTYSRSPDPWHALLESVGLPHDLIKV
jgi:hypothetical protein